MTCPCGRWTPAGHVSADVRAEVAEVTARPAGSVPTLADEVLRLLDRREAEARAAGLAEARRAILGDESTIWLKERGVDLYRFAHRDERLGCSITETYVKESDVAAAFDAALAARSDQDGA